MGVKSVRSPRGKRNEELTINEQRIANKQRLEPYLSIVKKCVSSATGDGKPVTFTEEEIKPLLVINTLLWMTIEPAGLLESAEGVTNAIKQPDHLAHVYL